MSWLDIGLIIICIVGAVRGYREGFLMELFSLVGIVLGILGGFKLMGIAIVLLNDWIELDRQLLPYIAFAVVFIGIVLAVGLLGRILKASIDKSFLGRIDEAAGGLLGLAKTVFLLSVGLWLLESLHISIPGSVSDDSRVAPYIASFAPQVTAWISELLPAFNDIFE